MAPELTGFEDEVIEMFELKRWWEDVGSCCYHCIYMWKLFENYIVNL